MTTPKEALEQIANVETSLDKTTLLCQIATMKQIAAEALASLQGEDAVERVARIIDPQAWRDRDYYDDYRRLPASEHPATKSSITKARAILATGLVQDEAAIRADEREKQRERDARVADEHASSYENEWNRKLGKSNDLVEACEDIAAAIRSGGGE